MAMAMSGKAMMMFVNEDLLTEIFVHLPSKSLVRFKSVSKYWLSLISSSPSLILLRRRRRRQGLLIHKLRNFNRINFIPLNSIINNNNNHVNANANANANVNDDDDYPDLFFFRKLYAIHLITSSNGLLFCASSCHKYHVLNPTTMQFLTVREPNLTHFGLVGLGLIFDPSKSIHYKLVCLWKSDIDFQVEIYSSETKYWKVLHHCKSPLPSNYYNHLTFYPAGIYWNDAIIWFPNGNGKSDCLIFDTQKEQVRTLPNRESGLEFCFGESGGHLYAVEWYRNFYTKAFRVYEMKEDLSGWLVTYTGDLSQIESGFRVLSLVWTNDDEKPHLVLDLESQIVSSNLEEEEDDMKINEVSGVQPPLFNGESSRYNFTPDVFQYVECHSSVSPL
ncbi:F-box protein At5g07610-like [Impatiens glandulifera]|uniref:F-box protein At5g07610-like n=1 Tax=Impatiens glandulifera TaxID=253017 RepID=UPI001FB09F56|nr:F-box protein At5g07610-like [Impatiens glandulifera]